MSRNRTNVKPSENKPALLIDGKPIDEHLPHVKEHQRAASGTIAALAGSYSNKARRTQPHVYRHQDRGNSDDDASQAIQPECDAFVPDPQVIRELGITAMSLWRWDRDQTLIAAGWPPP